MTKMFGHGYCLEFAYRSRPILVEMGWIVCAICAGIRAFISCPHTFVIYYFGFSWCVRRFELKMLLEK